MIVCTVVLSLLNRREAEGSFFLIILLSCVAVGGLVATRRPRNPIGWFFLASAVCFALQSLALEYATYGLITDPGSLPAARAMAWLQAWIWVPGVALLLTLLPLYFPDGRLVSPRWRWVVGFALFLYAIMAATSALLPDDARNSGLVNPFGAEELRPVLDPLDAITLPAYFAVLFAAAASLVVRFRRAASEERQQIKWLAYAAAAVPIWFALNAPIQAAFPLLFSVMDTVIIGAVPVAAGIAVLRYRLYDIDLIINRTLVYGALSLSLALVYGGCVISLQYAFGALTGTGAQLAVVASTLAIAALFNPLRRRIQEFIDRRFYRGRYDAGKALASFSARLREETDLGRLGDDLIWVVRDTMQPSHVSLWLRSDAPTGRGGESWRLR